MEKEAQQAEEEKEVRQGREGAGQVEGIPMRRGHVGGLGNA